VRIVLDTNVFISGIFFGGPPARILEAWRDHRITLVISRAILDEYEQVTAELGRRYQHVNPSELLRLVLVAADFVAAQDLVEPVCTDPDDDKFLACAIAGGVPMIVSGDRALLRVDGFAGVRVVTPRAFVDRSLKGE
jgi:putative PIN family toxin of toxin-antitoxin system